MAALDIKQEETKDTQEFMVNQICKIISKVHGQNEQAQTEVVEFRYAVDEMEEDILGSVENNTVDLEIVYLAVFDVIATAFAYEFWQSANQMKEHILSCPQYKTEYIYQIFRDEPEYIDAKEVIYGAIKLAYLKFCEIKRNM